MSPFVVSSAHLQTLVGAGLAWRNIAADPLRWYWNGPDGVSWDDLQHDLPSRVQPQPMRPQVDRVPLQSFLDQRTATSVAQELHEENVRSVNYRYTEQTTPETIATPAGGWLRFATEARRDGIGGIFKALDCYEYQSCETHDWEATEAYAFCQSLRGHLVASLPGYATAPWEITEPIAPTSTSEVVGIAGMAGTGRTR